MHDLSGNAFSGFAIAPMLMVAFLGDSIIRRIKEEAPEAPADEAASSSDCDMSSGASLSD